MRRGLRGRANLISCRRGIAHTISASTHGRYLTEPAAQGKPLGLLVGFHGYAEAAEAQLERLRSIPGSADWLLVSIQGLHRFYNRRSQEVVASWMTRQDRELAIADNLRVREWRRGRRDARVARRHYRSSSPVSRKAWPWRVARRADVRARWPASSRLVATCRRSSTAQALSRIPAAFVARGARDEWYSPEKWAADQTRLGEAGVDLTVVRLRRRSRMEC